MSVYWSVICFSDIQRPFNRRKSIIGKNSYVMVNVPRAPCARQVSSGAPTLRVPSKEVSRELKWACGQSLGVAAVTRWASGSEYRPWAGEKPW